MNSSRSAKSSAPACCFALAIEAVEAAQNLDQQFALRGVERGDQRVLRLFDLLPHALEQIVGVGAALALLEIAGERRDGAQRGQRAIGAQNALGAFQRGFQVLLLREAPAR